jgi:alpha-D-ribose 1-methylphosphonate 5-triphosphate synthase subunit PhnI
LSPGEMIGVVEHLRLPSIVGFTAEEEVLRLRYLLAAYQDRGGAK